MVGHVTLDHGIGVRIPASQPERAPHLTEVPILFRNTLLKAAFKNREFEPIFTLKKAPFESELYQEKRKSSFLNLSFVLILTIMLTLPIIKQIVYISNL